MIEECLISREQAVQLFNNYSSDYYIKRFFSEKYECNKKELKVSVFYVYGSEKLFIDNFILETNKRSVFQTKNIRELRLTNRISDDLESKLFDLKINFIMTSDKFWEVRRNKLSYDNLFERKKNEEQVLLDILDGVFLIFDDCYLSTTKYNIEFNKIRPYLNPFIEVKDNIEELLNEITIKIESEIPYFKNDSGKSKTKNRINKIDYYNNFRIAFIKKFEMFLRVSGYEIINFKEYLDIDFLNEKSVIYSKLKK